MMAGLNHEATDAASATIWPSTWKSPATGPTAWATSASPAKWPCLWDRPLTAAARPAARGQDAGRAIWPACGSIARELCPRYTARVIRGVRVGPSPAWLVDRLATIGIARDQQRGRHHQLRADGVRPAAARFRSGRAGRAGRSSSARPAAGETFVAINHKTYALEPGMCVIADAQRAGGLGRRDGRGRDRSLGRDHATC